MTFWREGESWCEGLIVYRKPYPHIKVGNVKGRSVRVPVKLRLGYKPEETTILEYGTVEKVQVRGRVETGIVRAWNRQDVWTRRMVMLQPLPGFEIAETNVRGLTVLAQGITIDFGERRHVYLIVLEAGTMIKLWQKRTGRVWCLHFEDSGNRLRSIDNDSTYRYTRQLTD